MQAVLIGQILFGKILTVIYMDNQEVFKGDITNRVQTNIGFIVDKRV